MPNLEDDQFCLEVVARPSRPGCDIKHCEGLYDTKYFKSPSNWEKEQLIWEIRRLPLYPEGVQCIPLGGPYYCLRHMLMYIHRF